MKIIAPTYYKDFHCIAGKCKHTCCQGWEIDVDKDKLDIYLSTPEIASHIKNGEAPHFILSRDERCPFLNNDNLCELIINHGEEILCQICRDHPRFRNYWSDRTEIGLGLVCEEAAKIILSSPATMQLTVIEDDGNSERLDEEDEYLLSLREKMLSQISETGPSARLLEYLIYRHLPNALYDGRLDERIAFIVNSHKALIQKWQKTDRSLESLIEIVRLWSYDVEYDEDELEKQLSEYEKISE